MISSSEELKAARVETAERSVKGCEEKIAKLEAHLEGAREALEIAKAELKAVREADHEFVAPGEHVTAKAR
jgi:multidrug resistance efflux pump